MSESTIELAEDTPNELREYIKRLEGEAKTGREAQSELATTTRRATFLEAGLRIDDPKQQDFFKAYDGELTVDAIKAAAIERGYIDPNPAAPGQAAADRIAGAAGGDGGGDMTVESFKKDMAEAHTKGGRKALLALLDKHGIGSTIVQ